jgi:hypothetical protein
MSLLAAIISVIPSHSSLLVFPELDYGGPTRSGVGAIFSNPAGLWGEGKEVVVSGGLWFTDSRLSVAGVRLNSWGLRLSYLDYGQLEFQDETPDDEGGPVFRPYTFEASLMRAFRPDEETRIGIAAGYIRQGIYDQGYTADHVSVGIIHAPERLKGFAVAAGVRNLGLDKITDLVEESIPTQFYAGLSYRKAPRSRARSGQGPLHTITPAPTFPLAPPGQTAFQGLLDDKGAHHPIRNILLRQGDRPA